MLLGRVIRPPPDMGLSAGAFTVSPSGGGWAELGWCGLVWTGLGWPWAGLSLLEHQWSVAGLLGLAGPG